jgi:hypothetical protein
MMLLNRHIVLATALAAILAAAPIHAQDVKTTQDTIKTNPGFNPGSGQINEGGTKAIASSSTDIRKIPTHAEALAALRMVDDPNPSLGADALTQVGTSNAASETVGAGAATTASAAQRGPIGATGQTMPSKFSERNDVLDRLPTMAWPLRLTDEERQQIYKAVMADPAQPAADADALTPASQLSAVQALNGIHPLPAGVSGIAALDKLSYVKGKNKVLLVLPATRTVVDEIAS